MQVRSGRMTKLSKLRPRLKTFNLREIEWKPQEGMLLRRRWQRMLCIGYAKAKKDGWTSRGNKRDMLWHLVNYPILKSPRSAIENRMRYGNISCLVPQIVLPWFPLLIPVSAVLITSSLCFRILIVILTRSILPFPLETYIPHLHLFFDISGVVVFVFKSTLSSVIEYCECFHSKASLPAN